MKKIISLVLVAFMCLSLCACANPSRETAQDSSVKATASAQTEITETEDDGRYTAFVYEGEAIDALTVEEVVLTPTYFPSNDRFYLKWMMKIRNTSGADIPMKESSMRVWYRYLDENLDSLHELYGTAGYSSTVKDGRAEWIIVDGHPAQWTNKDVLDIAYIEIYGYTISLHGLPDYEFTKPVLVDVRDFFDWETVKSHSRS